MNEEINSRLNIECQANARITCKYCKKITSAFEPLCCFCGKRQSLNSRISKNDFIELYNNNSCEQIGKIYKISTIYVQRLKREYGIAQKETKGTKRMGYSKGKARRSVKERITEDEFRRLYVDENKTMSDLEKHYGISRQTLHKYRKKYGIEEKNRSSYSGYSLDENYFQRWSVSMAWVLGLIITDGNIGYGAWGDVLSFGSTDKELPEKMLRAMASNMPVKEKKPRGYSKKTQFWFQISNVKLLKDLMELGLTHKKSLTVDLPEVPKYLFRHFLRGVFEGDGSIYINNSSSKGDTYYIKIVSGSQAFIIGLQETIERYYGISGKLYKSKGKEFYDLRYTAKESVFLIGYIMYENVSEDLALARKKNIYDNFLNTLNSESLATFKRMALTLDDLVQISTSIPEKMSIESPENKKTRDLIDSLREVQ